MPPLTIGSGVTETLTASGSYSPVTFGTLSTLDVSGVGVTVTLADITAVGLDTFDVSNGATMDLASFTVVSGGNNYDIGNNGALEIGAGVNGYLLAPINFDNTAGHGAELILDLGYNASLLNGINTWLQGDTIDVVGRTVTNTHWIQNVSGGGTLTAGFASGPTDEFVVDSGQYTTSNFAFSGSDIFFACFVTGTGIDTPAGPVAVEDLREGDLVLLASGGTRAVKWIGRRSLDIQRHADPRMVRPIRIDAGAIAEGVPRRDLLVSPDHALFIEGKLIPARLLRNGTTIREEPNVRYITYYHVELDVHDVLLAEGLPAESYLDTGNRAGFENAAGVVELHPDFRGGRDQGLREAGSCAPFASGAAEVKPVWRSLASRAEALGYVMPKPPEVSRDPELALIAAGRRIRPAVASGSRYAFIMPVDPGSVRLVSRKVAPCDLEPWVEDHRELGVMVKRLTLRHGNDVRTVALDDPTLSKGWWNVERDEHALWRWTSGDAELGLLPAGAILEVELAEQTLAYPVAEAAQDAVTIRQIA